MTKVYIHARGGGNLLLQHLLTGVIYGRLVRVQWEGLLMRWHELGLPRIESAPSFSEAPEEASIVQAKVTKVTSHA